MDKNGFKFNDETDQFEAENGVSDDQQGFVTEGKVLVPANLTDHAQLPPLALNFDGNPFKLTGLYNELTDNLEFAFVGPDGYDFQLKVSTVGKDNEYIYSLERSGQTGGGKSSIHSDFGAVAEILTMPKSMFKNAKTMSTFNKGQNDWAFPAQEHYAKMFPVHIAIQILGSNRNHEKDLKVLAAKVEEESDNDEPFEGEFGKAMSQEKSSPSLINNNPEETGNREKQPIRRGWCSCCKPNEEDEEDENVTIYKGQFNIDTEYYEDPESINNDSNRKMLPAPLSLSSSRTLCPCCRKASCQRYVNIVTCNRCGNTIPMAKCNCGQVVLLNIPTGRETKMDEEKRQSSFTTGNRPDASYDDDDTYHGIQDPVYDVPQSVISSVTDKYRDKSEKNVKGEAPSGKEDEFSAGTPNDAKSRNGDEFFEKSPKSLRNGDDDFSAGKPNGDKSQKSSKNDKDDLSAGEPNDDKSPKSLKNDDDDFSAGKPNGDKSPKSTKNGEDDFSAVKPNDDKSPKSSKNGDNDFSAGKPNDDKSPKSSKTGDDDLFAGKPNDDKSPKSSKNGDDDLFAGKPTDNKSSRNGEDDFSEKSLPGNPNLSSRKGKSGASISGKDENDLGEQRQSIQDSVRESVMVQFTDIALEKDKSIVQKCDYEKLQKMDIGPVKKRKRNDVEQKDYIVFHDGKEYKEYVMDHMPFHVDDDEAPLLEDLHHYKPPIEAGWFPKYEEQVELNLEKELIKVVETDAKIARRRKDLISYDSLYSDAKPQVLSDQVYCAVDRTTETSLKYGRDRTRVKMVQQSEMIQLLEKSDYDADGDGDSMATFPDAILMVRRQQRTTTFTGPDGQQERYVDSQEVLKRAAVHPHHIAKLKPLVLVEAEKDQEYHHQNSEEIKPRLEEQEEEEKMASNSEEIDPKVENYEEISRQSGEKMASNSGEIKTSTDEEKLASNYEELKQRVQEEKYIMASTSEDIAVEIKPTVVEEEVEKMASNSEAIAVEIKPTVVEEEVEKMASSYEEILEAEPTRVEEEKMASNSEAFVEVEEKSDIATSVGICNCLCGLFSCSSCGGKNKKKSEEEKDESDDLLEENSTNENVEQKDESKQGKSDDLQEENSTNENVDDNNDDDNKMGAVFTGILDKIDEDDDDLDQVLLDKDLAAAPSRDGSEMSYATAKSVDWNDLDALEEMLHVDVSEVVVERIKR